MTRSAAANVAQYLAGLPDDRRPVVSAVRSLILRHLPPGYQESLKRDMICYEVPAERYPGLPRHQPLLYAALAVRKGAYTLHLMTMAGREAWLEARFAAAGRKLDMGKACVHFRSLEDLPLDVVADVIAGTPVDAFIAWFESARRSTR